MIMKKILMFMAIVIAVVSLSSCNSFEDKAKNPLEDKAEKQLRVTMEEFAKNPETFKITNEKVIFSNDSMCTISFIGKGQNGFGGYSSSELEYTLVKCKDNKGKIIYYESLLDMENEDEKEMSIQEAINDIDYGSPKLFKELKKEAYDNNIKKGMSKEYAKANYLYIRAIVNLSDVYGRKVEDND